MKKEEVRKQIARELEAEAAALEQKIEGTLDFPAAQTDEEAYADLLARAEAGEEAKVPAKPRRLRTRTYVAAALAAVLLLAVGMVGSGARLFTPQVTEREDGTDVLIDSGETGYLEVSEEEAYTKIEEELGILALRLGYKPEGMELTKVFVDAEMGEAEMAFIYQEKYLKIYENKQNEDAAFNLQSDGEFVDKTDVFYLGEELEILKIDKKDGAFFYATQLEQGNAYYYISSDMDLEKFKEIVFGILSKVCDLDLLDRILSVSLQEYERKGEDM